MSLRHFVRSSKFFFTISLPSYPVECMLFRVQKARYIAGISQGFFFHIVEVVRHIMIVYYVESGKMRTSSILFLSWKIRYAKIRAKVTVWNVTSLEIKVVYWWSVLAFFSFLLSLSSDVEFLATDIIPALFVVFLWKSLLNEKDVLPFKFWIFCPVTITVKVKLLMLVLFFQPIWQNTLN